MTGQGNSAARAAGIAALKRLPRLRAAVRHARSWAHRCTYAWHARGAIDPQHVVFESFTGRSFAGSPRALYEAMLDDPKFAGFRFSWVLRDVAHAQSFPALSDPRTTIVSFLSPGYYRAYGQAGTWVGNSILPDWIAPRAGQRYVQTWHGTPLKRIGLDVVDQTESALNAKEEIAARYRSEGRKVTHFLSSSPFESRAFTSAFALPGGERSPLRETGAPRNDALVRAGGAGSAAARERLGLPATAKVVLYAPTWRDDQHAARAGYVYRSPLDFGELRRQLGEGWVVLFRVHYLAAAAMDQTSHGDFVRDVSGLDDITDLYLAADMLVTDYSSAFFDFALLDRPMVFYCYDVEHYQENLRGFYLPLSMLPGPIARTQDQLAAALLDPALGQAHAQARAGINATYNPLADGHASQRVLDLLWEKPADR